MDEMRREGLRRSFYRGFVLTLAAAVLVPVIVDIVLHPFIEGALNGADALLFSGPVLTTVVLWSAVLLLRSRISGATILKKYGLAGVLGLIAAYWYLGDVTRAAVPLLSLAAVLAVWKRMESMSESGRG